MASSARTEQWSLGAGRPPNASVTARLVSFMASATGLPLISSVAMELDKDLAARQEARLLCRQAEKAQGILAGMSQERLDAIVEA